jgi:hypothetical protein
VRNLTVDLVMSFDPCYSRARVETLAAGRAELTPLEACDLPIPAADRLWLLLREEFLPAAALHWLACNFAEDALQAERAAGREPDARSWAAIEAKRRWLRGEVTTAELRAVCRAAMRAARAASEAAATAARAAAWAGGAATRAVEEQQLAHVREVLQALTAGYSSSGE